MEYVSTGENILAIVDVFSDSLQTNHAFHYRAVFVVIQQDWERHNPPSPRTTRSAIFSGGAT
jgi:hypothetical protein